MCWIVDRFVGVLILFGVMSVVGLCVVISLYSVLNDVGFVLLIVVNGVMVVGNCCVCFLLSVKWCCLFVSVC